MAIDVPDWPWNELEIVPKLGLTLLLAAGIGWERERKSRPAGLRTHLLVALSVTLVTAMGEVLVARYAGAGDGVSVDPTRVVHGLLTGIGFIGAGTIFVMRDQNTVRGLTTAASVFAVTAIGIAVGLGLYLLATAAAICVFAILQVLGRIERAIQRRADRAR